MNAVPSSNSSSSNGSSLLQSSSYQHVTCKKASGTIILNDSSLTFYPAKTAATASNPTPLQYTWESIAKHQVSPSNHPRNLLKVTLHKSSLSPATNDKKSTTQAYEFQSRSELERIRKDVSTRLVASRRVQAQNAEGGNIEENGSRKRKIDSLATPGMSPKSTVAASVKKAEEPSTSSFTCLTQSENYATRSSLLAFDRNIRSQYSLLAENSATANDNAKTPEPTITEHDFWQTHKRMGANQAAKTHGFVSKGISSAMKSSLDIQITGNVSKPIKLGVEEMRQIFIMYPSVHDTYEEKVPLELSEEQFWRKYLESEYFHRDRGRIGSSARTVTKEKDTSGQAEEDDEKKKSKDEDKEREETARMGAASSNDIFSRKELALQKRNDKARNSMPRPNLKDLAVGQFDLTATANTERGSKLLLNSNDLHPFDDRGKKVIEKYNKHWAMVLNPGDASAGCDLIELARRSAQHSLKDDNDAKVNGGFGQEMARLVNFAGADEMNVDHVKGMGKSANDEELEDVLFEELNLRNVDGYAGKKLGAVDEKVSVEKMRRDAMFTQIALNHVKKIIAPLMNQMQSQDHNGSSVYKLDDAFPDARFGSQLLGALTKHMVQDNMSEKDTAKMTKSLPETFRERLTFFTRRSNELLRHFFALRHVMEDEKKLKKSGTKSSKKLKKIVMAMEGVYREMEGMRKDLPLSELGEQMRKMCLPIMDQLDWAFKLNLDSSGSGGGFVTVED